jgi:hypothetical protein
MHRGLRTPQRRAWGTLIASVSVLILACWCVGLTASIGGLGGAVALIQASFATVASLITSLWLLWSLNGWNKAVTLLVSFLFPLTLFSSIHIGDTHSPDAVIRHNGTALVQAIDRYHTASGTYPKTLNELVPSFLTALPEEPKTIWGWLYTSSDNTFTVGYVYDVGKWGYSVCLYRSADPKWDCLPNSTGPFVLQPTPMR